MKMKVIISLIAAAATIGGRVVAQPVTNFPVHGDETPIAALLANPRKYVEQPLIISGAVEIQNYYNYGYENASKTHFSLSFAEFTKDVKPSGALTIYAERKLAQPLVDTIVKVQHEGRSKAVRMTVKITTRCFEDGVFNESAELLDWQFLDPKTHEWGDWAHKPPTITPEQKAAQAKAEQAKRIAELERIAAGKQATLKFYQSKAEAGESYAQYRLGEIYLRGQGVETNIVLAKKWLTAALANGRSDAERLLHEIEKQQAPKSDSGGK